MARVYAIASAKGGVGKTTTTANLGATLAETGADVVVIDGDIGMANLGAALGVRPHGATLHDALSGAAEPEAAAYEGPAGMGVVPGDTSLEAFSAADPQQLQSVVDAFDNADYVLIDVGAGVSHETSVPLSVADAVVLVSTPERDALVDTEKTRQLTDRLGGVVAGAVLTRTDEATPVEEIISGTLNASVLTTIPEDEAVRESIAVGEPLVSYAPHSEAAAAYRRLATELTGIELTPPEPPQPESTQSEPTSSESTPSEPASPEPSSAEPSPADSDPSPQSTAASGSQPSGPATDPETAGSAETAPNDQSKSDADHNVVNPFAATPEDESATTDQPESAESKWAEAATGTGGEAASDDISIDPEVARDVASDDGDSEDISIDPVGREATSTERDSDDISIDPLGQDVAAASDDSDDISIDPASQDAAAAGDDSKGISITSPADHEAETGDEDGDSVPPDAIPFGGSESEEADADPDEESAQTTVLGEAIDEQDANRAADESDPKDDDGPLIPNAEETAAASAEADADDTERAEAEEADDDDEEKRGFFSRLFR